MNREQLKHRTYLNIAKEIANLSHATRQRVGAIIVKDGQIIAEGYNGTPRGFDNECETYEVDFGNPIKIEPRNFPEVDVNYTYTYKVNSVTKPEVLHAESNAITKVAKSTQSSNGSILYTTLSPCFECSKLIIQSGIKEIYYEEEYRDTSGIGLLKKAGIKVIKL